ncbi:hypothetical protein DP091_19455 [Paenibacillus sp. MDMC362]|nr:hypothetical protein DP091_19455 [Paenibacillus sp. MDMC362]
MKEKVWQPVFLIVSKRQEVNTMSKTIIIKKTKLHFNEIVACFTCIIRFIQSFPIAVCQGLV